MQQEKHRLLIATTTQCVLTDLLASHCDRELVLSRILSVRFACRSCGDCINLLPAYEPFHWNEKRNTEPVCVMKGNSTRSMVQHCVLFVLVYIFTRSQLLGFAHGRSTNFLLATCWCCAGVKLFILCCSLFCLFFVALRFCHDLLSIMLLNWQCRLVDLLWRSELLVNVNA